MEKTAERVIASELDPYAMGLDEIDLSRPDLFYRDNHVGIFDRLRAEDPVYFQKGNDSTGPFWNVTRYDDILSVDTNHTVFSSRNSSFMEDMPHDFFVSMFLAMDPPRHTVYRNAVRPAFSARHIAGFEDTIRSRTKAILDALPVDEEFDWVSRVSMELTSQVLANLFDFPFERRHKLIEWSDLAVQKTTGGDGAIVAWEERKASFMECLQQFNELKDARANHNGIDLVSLLANTHSPKPLKPSDFLGNLLMLMFAGNDTTRNSITGGVVAFNRFPDQFRRLQGDPGLLAGAVQEIFRWQTPVAYMRRIAVMDTDLGGKRIKAGDKVVIWYASGNRDERMFDRPHDFDVDRRTMGKHLAFGYGVHRCIGLRLADLQMRILWQELLERFAWIEVLREPTYVCSPFIKGYSRLPVRLHPKRGQA